MLVQYDPVLVVLSVAVAIMGSFTGLVLTSGAPWLTSAPPKLRILKGAIAIGGGIWSMHFIGMLAVQLPIAVKYDVLRTFISAFTAILVTGLGLYVCSYRSSSKACIVIGGVFMGSGIAGMHYIGMSAIRAACVVSYSLPGLVLSLAIAICASAGALWFAFRSSDIKEIAPGGAMLGLTISVMHYVAMFSTSFIPLDDVAEIATPVFTSDFIAIAVALASFIFCGLFLLMALPDGSDEEQSMQHAANHGLANLTPTPEPSAVRKRISVEKDGAILFLDPDDIWSVAAHGHYSIVTNKDAEYFCDMPISKIEKIVAGSGIIRSHRSFLVNLHHVKALSRKGDRGLLILDGSSDGTVPVSRSKFETIRQQLELGPETAQFSYS